MISRVAQLIIILGSVWAIADAVFNLEHSWLLFIHRALAPVLLVTALVASCASLLWMRKRLSFGLLLVQFLIVTACAAPLVRSLLLLPSPAPPLASASSSLTLFNYNVLGFEDLSSRVVQEISSLQPDVVTLQEVNPELAKALQDNLRSKYPCQLLDPKEGSWGMGTLSKFPCAELPAPQRGLWVGKPQITKITLPQNNELVIANIHAIHPHVALQRGAGAFGWLRMTDTIRNREETIKTLLNELRATDISNVIIAGDLNASMRNKIYQTVLNSGFVDSWLELYPASSGGTWPVPGIAGTSFLSGTLRIDFIFRSRTLRTKSIELLSESIGSDHRGMFAAFDVQ